MSMPWLTRPLRMVAAGLLFAAIGGTLHAQGLGSLVGTVTDPSGGIVVSATVKITDEGTSATRETTTNGQGSYVFTTLRPSTYTLTVDAAGFATAIRRSVVLQADQTATINVEMSIQKTGESVTVEAAVAQVDTSTSTLSEVVDRRRIGASSQRRKH